MDMQQFARILNRHRITAQQFAILAMCNNPAAHASMGELAEEISANPVCLTGLVDRMVTHKGWLIRSHDEDDRRRILVSLTPQGKELLAKLAGEAQTVS